MRNKLNAFTLIELLIVVAIIAILAAIAVPNFLEAQTRAKVSRAKNDERAMATALESYYVDHNEYPPNNAGPVGGSTDITSPQFELWFVPLSTPVAYITDAWLEDPFGTAESPFNTGAGDEMGSHGKSIYFYLNQSPGDVGVDFVIGFGILTDAAIEHMYERRWLVSSAGPDRVFEVQTDTNVSVDDFIQVIADFENGLGIYDPTNGTISRGDINRTHKAVQEGGNIN